MKPQSVPIEIKMDSFNGNLQKLKLAEYIIEKIGHRYDDETELLHEKISKKVNKIEERLTLLEKAYIEFFETVEYRVFGCLKIDGALIIEVVTLFAITFLHELITLFVEFIESIFH